MPGKLILASLIFVLLNTSCYIVNSNDSDNGLEGSGDIVTETRSCPDFNAIEMATAGKVYLTSGPVHAVTVSVDDNVLEYITTSVKNEKLFIGVQRGVQLSDFNLVVNITLTDLHELITSSAGSIIGKNKFEADFVRLMTSSAGDIKLELAAGKLESICSSAGDLFLKGNVTEHNAIVASAGNLYAFNLITNTTRITISSAGNAEVYATQLLDATLSSVGSLYYKGHPTITHRISSLGRIIDAN